MEAAVTIELKCEKCGKTVRAPREGAGRRGKCPYCDASVYIPTPEDELQELPLAEESEADLHHEKALQDERRRIERAWQRERAPADDDSRQPPARASSRPAASSGEGIEATVLAYMLALRDSNLTAADDALAVLLKRRPEARQVVQNLASDQIPPPELAGVPNAVYQGFLKNLISQL
jgi:hypothetical protein